MCLRSTSEENDISQTILRRMLNDLVRHDLIEDKLPLLRTHYGDCRGDWELCIAFDLCPCIEIYPLADYRMRDKWGWKKITHRG